MFDELKENLENYHEMTFDEKQSFIEETYRDHLDAGLKWWKSTHLNQKRSVVTILMNEDERDAISENIINLARLGLIHIINEKSKD